MDAARLLPALRKQTCLQTVRLFNVGSVRLEEAGGQKKTARNPGLYPLQMHQLPAEAVLARLIIVYLRRATPRTASE